MPISTTASSPKRRWHEENEEMSTEKKKIRKGPRIAGLLIVLALIISGGIFGYYRISDMVRYVSTEDASIDAVDVQLAARVLGRIVSLPVMEGESVNAGDVLVILDAADLKAQEAQSSSSLEFARANLKLADINRYSAREDFQRINRLFASGSSSRESYDHARSAVDIAEASYHASEVQVDTAASQLQLVQTRLLDTIIRSPIDGTADRINMSVGDVVQPGQPILTVFNLNNVWVVANIKETDIAKVKTGAPVIVSVDAFPGRDFPGTVETIQSAIVPPAFQIGEFTKTTRRIPVKIRLEGVESIQAEAGKLRLLPGMSVVVKINREF